MLIMNTFPEQFVDTLGIRSFNVGQSFLATRACSSGLAVAIHLPCRGDASSGRSHACKFTAHLTNTCRSNPLQSAPISSLKEPHSCFHQHS